MISASRTLAIVNTSLPAVYFEQTQDSPIYGDAFVIPLRYGVVVSGEPWFVGIVIEKIQRGCWIGVPFRNGVIMIVRTGGVDEHRLKIGTIHSVKQVLELPPEVAQQKDLTLEIINLMERGKTRRSMARILKLSTIELEPLIARIEADIDGRAAKIPDQRLKAGLSNWRMISQIALEYDVPAFAVRARITKERMRLAQMPEVRNC